MKRTESKIQSEIVKYIRLLYPRSILFSVPNGGKRNVVTGSILKREGAMPGVSDLVWIFKGVVYFFEVKTEKGAQSESQKEFRDMVIVQGFDYTILKSTKDFDSFIKEKGL